MYCGQCGKKVMDNMLFCPFCGAPIVIPDQDAPEAPAPEPAVQPVEPPVKQPAAEAAPERPLSLFDDVQRPAKKAVPEQVPLEAFEPLRFDFDAPEQPAPQEESAEQETPQPEENAQVEDVPEDIPAQQLPPKRRNMPKRPENNRKRSANTYIPVKEMDMDDIFMDGGDEEDEYDMDDGYSDPYGGRYADSFEYEEPESGSFFQRHIRGIVALILMLILLVVCAAWGISPRGQRVLAQVNLAWSAEAYADLGYEAYQKDSDLLAARYYEKALNRDPENYEYAHSAMVAYYEADKLENAAAMLKKCVDLDPDNPEPYEELLILYPDAQTRPWDISELVRMGYQRTGAQSLKQE